MGPLAAIAVHLITLPHEIPIIERLSIGPITRVHRVSDLGANCTKR